MRTETYIEPNGSTSYIIRPDSEGEWDEINEICRKRRAEERRLREEDSPEAQEPAKVLLRVAKSHGLTFAPTRTHTAAVSISRGQHRRASGAQTTRSRGSRRSSSGGGDPGGADADPDEPEVGPQTCARPDCDNPLPPHKGTGRPPIYCTDAACRRLRDAERQIKSRKGKATQAAEGRAALHKAALSTVDATVERIDNLAWQRTKAWPAYDCRRVVAELDRDLERLYAIKRAATIARGYSLDGYMGRTTTFFREAGTAA